MRMLRRAADTFIRLSQPRAPHIAASLIAAAAFLFLSGGVAQAQNPPQNPQMVLQGLLQKYRKCILEEYENQVSENDKNKTNPRALGPKRDAAICVAGNTCTRASRQDMYNRLKAQ